jgi:hypothetical protein
VAAKRKLCSFTLICDVRVALGPLFFDREGVGNCDGRGSGFRQGEERLLMSLHRHAHHRNDLKAGNVLETRGHNGLPRRVQRVAFGSGGIKPMR